MSSNREVRVRIVAKDDASPAFASLARNVDGAASKIDKASDKVSSSFVESSRESFKFTKSLDTTLLAIDRTAGALGRLGQASINQQRTVEALRVSYGAAADSILAYSQRLAESSNFSAQAAQQGALTASTLVKNYGLTTKEVEKLLSISADLAELYRIDLADAVLRTSSAIRGEAESSEILGLSLQDNYVSAQAAQRGMVGWATSMTDAEKASFRLTIMTEQATYAQGEAAKASETTRGQMADLTNQASLAEAALGGMVGPIGTMAVTASDAAVTFTVLSEGIVEMASKAKESAVVMNVLKAAISPVGVAIGAAVLAGGLLIRNWKEQEAAAAENEAAILSLRTQIELLGNANAEVAIGNAALSDTEIGGAGQVAKNLAATVFFLSEDLDKYVVSANEAQAINVLLGQSSAIAAKELDAYSVFVEKASEAVRTGVADADDYEKVLRAVTDIFQDQGSGAQMARDRTIDLMNVWAQTEGSLSDLAAGLAKVDDELLVYDKYVDDTTAAHKNFVQATRDALLGVQSFPNQAETDKWLTEKTLIEDAKKEKQAFLDLQTYGDSGVISFRGAGGASAEEAASAKIAADAVDDKAAADAKADAAARDAAAAAKEHASAMEQERSAAIDVSNAMIGTAQDRETAAQAARDAASAAIQAEQDYATSVSDIDKDFYSNRADADEAYQESRADAEESYQESRQQADQQYSDQIKEFAKNRVQTEKDGIKTLKGLDQQRVAAAKAAEQKLGEFADQRVAAQVDAQEKLADAEGTYHDALAKSNEAQNDLRKSIQEQTIDASRSWNELQAENARALANLQQEVAAAQADRNQDYKRALQDYKTDLTRLTEDYNTAISAPGLTSEDAAKISLDYEREKADLLLNQKRTQQDKNEADKEAQQDAKKQRDDMGRKQEEAARAYAAQIKDLHEQEAEQLKAIQEQRSDAAKEYAEQTADIRDQQSDQLRAIAEQEAETRRDLADEEADLAKQKVVAARENARALQELDRQRADAEKTYQENAAKQAAAFAKSAADATEAYTEARAKDEEAHAEALQAAADEYAKKQEQAAADAIANETDLQRLLREGKITQSEYNDLYAANKKVQETSKAIEDEKLILALKEIPQRQTLLDKELDRVKAAKDYNDLLEDRGDYVDPLDGPVPVKGAPPQTGGVTKVSLEKANDFSSDLAAIKTEVTDTLANIYASVSPTRAATWIGNIADLKQDLTDNFTATVRSAPISVVRAPTWANNITDIKQDLVDNFTATERAASITVKRGETWASSITDLKQDLVDNFTGSERGAPITVVRASSWSQNVNDIKQDLVDNFTATERDAMIGVVRGDSWVEDVTDIKQDLVDNFTEYDRIVKIGVARNDSWSGDVNDIKQDLEDNFTDPDRRAPIGVTRDPSWTADVNDIKQDLTENFVDPERNAPIGVERSETWVSDVNDIKADITDNFSGERKAPIGVTRAGDWVTSVNEIKGDIADNFTATVKRAPVSVALAPSYSKDVLAVRNAIERDLGSIELDVTVKQSAPAHRPRGVSETDDPGDGPPARALGGPGGGQWIMTGEYGPEAMWAPAGSYIMSAGATSARQGLQGFASGGVPRRDWKRYVEKQPQWLQDYMAKQNYSAQEKEQLLEGTAALAGDPPSVQKVPTADPPVSTKEKRNPDKYNSGDNAPAPTKPKPKPGAPPPPKPGSPGYIRTYEADRTGTAADLAVFGQEDTKSAQLERGLSQAVKSRSAAAASTLGSQANTAILADAVRKLERQIARLAEKLNREQNTQPLINYGTMYTQSSPGLSAATASARQAATALRL